MLTVASFTTAKHGSNRDYRKNRSTKCGTRIHTMGYYSVLKRKGIIKGIHSWNTMNESQGHYAKQSKPIKKRQILSDSTLMKYLE